MVCPENFYVVLVATTVETKNPHDELKPGLDLLGSIEQVFYSVEDLFEPLDDGRSSKVSFFRTEFLFGFLSKLLSH